LSPNSFCGALRLMSRNYQCFSGKIQSLECIKMYFLHQNMHLDRTAESDAFAAWLLQVGAGENTDNTGKIELPDYM
ncbi:hypothetical protein RYX56_24455, partial [Alkalihalophilus lindianensis]